MRRHSFWILVAVIVLGACQSGGEAPPRPAPEVTVAVPEQRDVMGYQEFTGRTEAVESVEIRARVSGELERQAFQASATVRKDQLLFVIEQAPYIARRNGADAEVKSWEAELARARSDLERLEQAIRTDAVSQQEVDRARADVQQAEASLLGAKARLEQAELDLSYTEVRAPIAGVVSRRLVDVGNLVGSGENTLLTTIARMDPIYVYFDVSERIVLELLSHRGRTVSERIRSPEEEVQAFLGLANEDGWPHTGRLDYVDNTVDANTGTIQIRGVFPNTDGLLFPGLFARIRVPTELQKGALLVIERAIGTDLGGKYLLIVGEGNMVELRHVELGRLEDGMRVIVSGLEAGERYIINGLQRARPGLPVSPKTASASAES
ncbi:MAG: efflux RND transporter periplasmic adaptor subunit [Acidobacteria bacterium]|nr:MAG: efflux RND transporter periplasmic adaptor subunit [Acidobacteriota bacterium]